MDQFQNIFFEAVRQGQISKVVDMLSRRIILNVNFMDTAGQSPVLVAASRNDLTMLKKLVEFGGSVHAVDPLGVSCRRWAEFHRNIEMQVFIDSVPTSSSTVSVDPLNVLPIRNRFV